MTASQGWYPDPSGSGQQRWYDGQTWTEAVLAAPGGSPAAAPATEALAPQEAMVQQISSLPPRLPFAWWWGLAGGVIALLVLLVFPGNVELELVLASYFLSAGVAATRTHPAWGLLWGLFGSAVSMAMVAAARALNGFDVTVVGWVEHLDTYLIGLGALFVVGVPAMLTQPRARAGIATVVGAVAGTAISLLVLETVFIYDWYALFYGLPLLSATASVLLMGGRPQRVPKAPARQVDQAGYPAGPMAQPTDTNGLAIASLVLGCVGASPLALIFGLIARSQIKRSGGRQGGAGMALAGVILGAVGIAMMVAYVVLFVAVFAQADSF